MNEITEYNEKVFEDIKHIDEFGNGYWYARELKVVLEYTLWQRFSNVIKKAVENCKNSNNIALNHFISADKMVQILKEKFKITNYQDMLVI